jgi:hypothetical protein
MTEFTKEYIYKVRVSSYLIEPPAGIVVGECLDEIERLQVRIQELEMDIGYYHLACVNALDLHRESAIPNIKDIPKIIEELRERLGELEAERRWIPVSARLPEEDGYYNIAFSISNAKNITDIYYFKSDSKYKWYSDVYCRSVATFFDTVSHWQNTIKPPESEEE